MQVRSIGVAIATLIGWLAVMATGLVGVAQAADPSIAKPYSAVLSPATVPAGARETITATITNRTKEQQLGSAELVVPTALTVSAVATSRGTVSPPGQRILVRDLSLAPGGAFTVTVTVDAACGAAGTHTWRLTAKQANDFRGPPGNDLTLDPTESAVTTTVTGSCALRYLATGQPRDARTGQSITARQFDPTGPAVAVEVIDGSGARISTSSAPVTVALGSNPVGGTLSGTRTVAAQQGVASFTGLTIDRPGAPYTLAATSPGLTSATSDGFVIADVAQFCGENVACQGGVSGNRVRLDVTAHPDPLVADAGFLMLSSNVGPQLDCPSYNELAVDSITVDVTAFARTKTVTYRIDKRRMNAVSNNGASFLQMCYGAPTPFITSSGVFAPGIDYDTDGDVDEYVGLLPDCGSAAAPCITSRRKDGSGDGIIVAEAPRGDPRYRG